VSDELYDEILCALCADDIAEIAAIAKRHPDLPVQLTAFVINEGGGEVYTSEEMLARVG
jgi:hypothetical protein